MNATEHKITLRPLEREDLKFVHNLDNNANVMRFWFEEPFFSLGELQQIYDRHIHDQTERRFIAMNEKKGMIGLVELVEINQIHRHCQFQIIVCPEHQGHGYAKEATQLALDYAFNVLNLHKVMLYVDVENQKAIHIYESYGFKSEGVMRQMFFVNGKYRDAALMGILKPEFDALNTERPSGSDK